MTILLSVTGFEPSRWLRALKQHLPQETVVTRPERADDPAIDYAIVWKQPPAFSPIFRTSRRSSRWARASITSSRTAPCRRSCRSCASSRRI